MHRNGNPGLGFPYAKLYIDIKQERWFLGSNLIYILSEERKMSFKNREKNVQVDNVRIKTTHDVKNQK